MLECPKCEKEIMRVSYCEKCGVLLWEECHVCGEPVNIGMNFCPKCGARLRFHERTCALNVSKVEYVYQKDDEANLLPVLRRLEGEIGGDRHPYGMRAGDIDLVSFLEIAVYSLASAAVATLVHKYFEGLFGDYAKEFGKRHRKQLGEWFSKFETDLKVVVQSFEHAYKTKIPFYLERKPMAAVICINIGTKILYVVLNHENVSPKLMANLPKGIIQALRFLAESPLAKRGAISQLYFDKTSNSWRYLFLPTKQGFGRWIDRYVDLVTRQVFQIGSQTEFIEKFDPHINDEFKFLVIPFQKPRR